MSNNRIQGSQLLNQSYVLGLILESLLHEALRARNRRTGVSVFR